MADDPKKKKADRKLVSQQEYEIDYLRKTTGAPRAAIEKAVKEVGPSRKAVVKALPKKK